MGATLLPPVAIATPQSAIINAMSVMIAQAITAHNKGTPFTIDWIPVFQFFLFGCVCTPPNFAWQDFLESTWPACADSDPPRPPAAIENGIKQNEKEKKKQPKLSVKNTLIKTLLDQTLGATLNTLLFSVFMHGIRAAMAHHYLGSSSSGFSTLWNAKGGTAMMRYDAVDWAVVWGKARAEFWQILTAGWRFWPFVSLVNFVFLTSVESRNLLGSLAGLGWGVYVSLFAGK